MLSAQVAGAGGTSVTPGSSQAKPLWKPGGEQGQGRGRDTQKHHVEGQSVVEMRQVMAATILAGVCCIREEDADKRTSQGVPSTGSLLGRCWGRQHLTPTPGHTSCACAHHQYRSWPCPSCNGDSWKGRLCAAHGQRALLLIQNLVLETWPNLTKITAKLHPLNTYTHTYVR